MAWQARLAAANFDHQAASNAARSADAAFALSVHKAQLAQPQPARGGAAAATDMEQAAAAARIHAAHGAGMEARARRDAAAARLDDAAAEAAAAQTEHHSALALRHWVLCLMGETMLLPQHSGPDAVFLQRNVEAVAAGVAAAAAELRADTGPLGDGPHRLPEQRAAAEGDFVEPLTLDRTKILECVRGRETALADLGAQVAASAAAELRGRPLAAGGEAPPPNPQQQQQPGVLNRDAAEMSCAGLRQAHAHLEFLEAAARCSDPARLRAALEAFRAARRRVIGAVSAAAANMRAYADNALRQLPHLDPEGVPPRPLCLREVLVFGAVTELFWCAAAASAGRAGRGRDHASWTAQGPAGAELAKQALLEALTRWTESCGIVVAELHTFVPDGNLVRFPLCPRRRLPPALPTPVFV